MIRRDRLLHQPRRYDADDFTRVSHPGPDPFLILLRRAHHQRRREVLVHDVVHDVPHRDSKRDARGEVHAQRRYDRNKAHVNRTQRIAKLFGIDRLGDDTALSNHQRASANLLRVRNTVVVLIQLVVLQVCSLRRLDVSPQYHQRASRARVPGDSIRLHRRRESGKISTEEAQEKSHDRRSELLRVVRLKRSPRSPASLERGDGVGLALGSQAARTDDRGRGLGQYRWNRGRLDDGGRSAGLFPIDRGGVLGRR